MTLRFLAATLVLAACLFAPQAPHVQGFAGAGSTFAHPIIARWGQAYSNLQGEGGGAVSVDGGFDYEPVGSLAGVLRVMQGAVDFGATDVPLPPADLDRAGLIQFPFVTGGVAVVANLPGLRSEALRLSGDLLARIYLGQVTRWSDAAIVALNPGVTLPNADIIVLRREDGSGTTYHFAAYLAASNEEWRQRVGVNTQLAWPTGIGARGNSQLADLTQTRPNAIAYIEASQAARRGLPVVLVENRAGRFLAPNVASLQAAAATANWDARQHFHQTVSAPTGAEAYPITATVFALMQRRPASRNRARLTLEFFGMALRERADDALALGFVPLPMPVVSQVADYWRNSPR